MPVEVFGVFGVGHDEFPSRFDFVAHEPHKHLLDIGVEFFFVADFDEASDFGVHCGFLEFLGIHFTETFESGDGDVFAFEIFDDTVSFFFVHGVEPLILPGANDEEGGLSEVEIAFGHEGLHVAIEECEEEGADVFAIDICVGHDNDFVVAEFCDVEVFAGALLIGRLFAIEGGFLVA